VVYGIAYRWALVVLSILPRLDLNSDTSQGNFIKPDLTLPKAACAAFFSAS
jgi:hypothetical protein